MIKTTGIIMLIYTMLLAPEISLRDVREMFYKASESRKVAEEFKEKMEKIAESNPTLLAYKAMSHMLLANYSYNPVNKITYFNRGKELLEKSIRLAPTNAEIRFLRFSVQTNAPSFLGYKTNIDQDKKIIVDYLNESDSDLDLEKRMKDYL